MGNEGSAQTHKEHTRTARTHAYSTASGHSKYCSESTMCPKWKVNSHAPQSDLSSLANHASRGSKEPCGNTEPELGEVSW